jgi:murein L,D-transpeptidase YafK
MTLITTGRIARYPMRIFLCMLLVLFYNTYAFAQGKGDVQQMEIKVLDEHRDAEGNLVRTIEYYKDGSRIRETRILKQFAGLNTPIDPDTLNKDSLMVVINKTRFVLDLYYKRKKIRMYKVVFGPKPKENKMMKGDRCTPEGKFSVLNKRPSARYNKFIQIDYPNDESRARFAMLKQKGLVPQNAEIGGDVGIHGVWPKGDDMIDMGIGWTDGCIALKNKDIDDLYRFLDAGVRVYIRK